MLVSGWYLVLVDSRGLIVIVCWCFEMKNWIGFVAMIGLGFAVVLLRRYLVEFADSCYCVKKTDLIVLAEHWRTGLIVVSD